MGFRLLSEVKAHFDNPIISPNQMAAGIEMINGSLFEEANYNPKQISVDACFCQI